MKKYVVQEEMDLGEFLKTKEKKWKNLLKYEKVSINGKKVTNYHHKLHINDCISLDYTKETSKDLDIIYEDKEFIAINKPSGLLTISTEKEKEKTLYHKVREYLHQKNEKVFILHRLDKDTSGIIVFCKNDKLKEKMQENWNSIVLKRYYMAIVKGHLEKKSGVIKNYLREYKNEVVVANEKDGKLAITNYKVLKQNESFSLVDIDLKTGRKNQIRVQFSNINHPVIGDVKYGSKDDRLYLHAYEFSFKHPITKKVYDFKIDIPRDFKKI